MLGTEATKRATEAIEARASERVTDAMKVVYGTLQSVIAKLVTALKAEKTYAIRATLFKSAKSVLDILPLLNFTADATLDAFAARDTLAHRRARGQGAARQRTDARRCARQSRSHPVAR